MSKISKISFNAQFKKFQRSELIGLLILVTVLSSSALLLLAFRKKAEPSFVRFLAERGLLVRRVLRLGPNNCDSQD